jgi:hypothetical protein
MKLFSSSQKPTLVCFMKQLFVSSPVWLHRLTCLLAITLVMSPVASWAQPNLSLDFSSPATNASPGATFQGNINYTPTGTVFSATVTSGTSIVPQANLSIDYVSSNILEVTLEPLTNTSGNVTVEVKGVSGSNTNTISFTAVFRPYPPTIAPISNRTIPEDGSTNVPFIVIDGDTPLNSLVLTATSTNTSLIDSSGMTFSGTGSNRFILLTPKPDINGASLITLSVSDGIFTNTQSFRLTVTPVADASTVTGLVNRSFGDDVPSTNVYANVGINDVDHLMPSNEILVVTATLANDQFATFLNNSTSIGLTGTPSSVSTQLASLPIKPLARRGTPGTINNVLSTVRVRGVADNITVTNSIQLSIEVINTPPQFGVILNPTSVVESTSAQPFNLAFIYDLDIGDNLFNFRIELVDTNQSNLVSITPTNTLQDNGAGLTANIRNINLVAASGVITNPTVQIPLRFVMTDGYGSSSYETNVMTLVQAKNPPQISGIPVQTVQKTDADGDFIIYPNVFVEDPDEGGGQNVRATISQSNPLLGTLSTTNIAFTTPAQLTLALRNLVFTPNPGALSVGQAAETIITLNVTDVANLNAQNNNLKIRITSVNKAPQILNIPPPAQQPVLIPPAASLKPFLGLGLTSDDTNNVLFTLSIDNVSKGAFTNLGSFTQSSPGVFQMSGSVTSILNSLTNISYILNPGFLFPVDDPGGTTFTLSARDFVLLTSTRTLYIQVQTTPRNHLVVRAQDDGLPGSFSYALANASNNDVVTFALPSYPAVIRLPGFSPNVLTRNLTIKGPGANLLSLSGDNNGDTVRDRQLFRIRSRVTMEGITLTHGTASFGGAILVESNGFLTLRNCAVVDSVAQVYGGAIDVDGGQLTLDGCLIARNRLSEDTGESGAGVSVYSDKEIQVINTTFAGNVQPNSSGDGGSALVVQDRTPATSMNAYLTHSTFIGNIDASDAASAAFSVDFGARIRAFNSIFNDFSGRNVDVSGTGEFISLGGNICDDSSLTINLQQGQSGDVFLLNHPSDETNTDALLAPLNEAGDPTAFAEPLPGSPAIGKGTGSTITIDQRGILRQGIADSGAVEFNALGRIVINEIHFESNQVNFVEIFVRRDSTPIDLLPYSLFIDGVKVHDFASGTIIGTNDLFTAGASASTVVNPGFGYVVAFTNSPVQLTSDINPTPVVRPSVTNIALDLQERGTVAIGSGGLAQPIALQSYLGVYLSPVSGTNILNTTGNSVALAPQYRGFALVPHSFILPGPFSGVDASLNPALNPFTPGAGSDGTAFGQNNAEPLAVPDIVTVTEDDLSFLDVLANDFDGDGNDRLVAVDVSTFSAADSGDAASTNSQLGAIVSIDPDLSPLRGEQLFYDPRSTTNLQALPVGVEGIDLFYYEVIDIGEDTVSGYADAGGGTTVVAAVNHRLTNGVQIVISGSSSNLYNGTYAVSVIDEDSFAIPATFAGDPDVKGQWTTVLPRSPSARSEASVNVRVVGVNDTPVAGPDIITNVTERSLARLMVRPELSGAPTAFPGDPIPAPVTLLNQNIQLNDDDIDSDDTWATLRVVGVMGSVNEIASYAGIPGLMTVKVTSPDHGLDSGTEILIANYGGHSSYNGYHMVTVLDGDTFTIPQFYVDDDADKGVWVILNDTNRYDAVTDVAAEVTLVLRANATEDHILYDASTSAFLQGLALGEYHTNRFFYAVEDRHGGVGIGSIDVIVAGVNNTPVANPDPNTLDQLLPLTGLSNALEQVLSNGLDLMYTITPNGVGSNRTDLHVLDTSGLIPDTIVLNHIFATDEDTPISIDGADLLANDTDIDRTDVLSVLSVESTSREGASVSLGGGFIQYNPSVSTNLQSLVRKEMVIDTFEAVISDSFSDGIVTSLVAVLVTGLNDTPVANPVFLTTHEDEVLVFDPRTNDVDIDINLIEPDDRLGIIPVTNWPNPGLAQVDMSTTNVTHDAPASQLLNQLADWQSFTNVFGYTITDNSFLFAVDDEFYVPAGTVNRTLLVLANDRDFTDAQGLLTIVDAGPALFGGTLSIASNGQSLVYSSPPGFVGDDYFRYTVQNDRGDVNSGRVLVRSTIATINGVLPASPDYFTVAAGETTILNVLANDNMLPASGSGLTISAIVMSSQPGQPVLTNNTLIFSATNGLAPVTFMYDVTGGGSSTTRAEVTVGIIERRGTLRIQHDAFSVSPGSFDNELDVLVNDGLVTEAIANLRIKEILTPASFGTASINAASNRIVYTPNAGFIGNDQLSVLITDQIGGTGTGIVSISVGQIDVASDFFKIAASTNTLPISLNVRANDQVLPNISTSLTIVSVSPDTPTAIGTLQVNGNGTQLLFTPSNVLGQLDFDYVVQDAGIPARFATGRVTIATVPSGIYANPDRYNVRGNGSAYVLHVLTNDISYPNVNKTYSLISIGVGPNAPNQGGSVTIVGTTLEYTPAPGFFGEETFTYTMTDSVATDVAQVSVSVRRGDMRANDDAYAVYYAIQPGTNSAFSFNLPVVLNDRIQPVLDQIFSISALGAGTNLPNQGGSLQIAPDQQSLIYRPVLATATSYVEQFTYEISDGTDRRSFGTVRVLVQNRASNLVAITQDDAYTVARNSTNNTLTVLANDFVRPGTAAGWSITSVSASLNGGSVSISDGAVRYSPPIGFVGEDSFTYSVTDGLGGTGNAVVTVKVGTMPTLPDLFTVITGLGNYEFDVVSNDILLSSYAEEYTLASVFGATAGGSIAIHASNRVVYTPSGSYTGSYPYSETFFYRVSDDASGLVTGQVRVIVHDGDSDNDSSVITLLVEGRNDQPEIDNPALPLSITDKDSIKPLTSVAFTEVDEQTIERVDITVSLDDAAKGSLRNLNDFVMTGPGLYALTNVTAATATLQIRDLVFDPFENRITVPTTEQTRFIVTITDNKSSVVVDTNSFVDVTAVNDEPEILGTVSGQTMYERIPIRLFAGVTIIDVDDLLVQPLFISITQSNAAIGTLTNLGNFVRGTNGLYVATNISAATASMDLRAMEFILGTNRVPVNGSITSLFAISVNDNFAPAVVDDVTSVIAYNASEGTLRPTNSALQGSFGLAVDTISDFAVVGALNSSANGTSSGSAFVYKRVVGVTNSWIEWQQLQPAQVETNDRFGRSVSITETLIAVGAINDETGSVEVGSVYLFERPVGGSNQWGEIARIVPTNVSSVIRFGFSVDLSGDLLAVGAPDAVLNGTNRQGGVFLFGRNHGGSNAWGEVARVFPTVAGITNSDFGWSVALNDEQLVVGAPRFDVNLATTNREGAVFYFAKDAGGTNAWGQVQRVVAAQTNLSNEFGWDVGLDAGLLAVGAPTMNAGSTTNAGVVHVFEFDATTNLWLEITRLDRRNDNERLFGSGVDVKGGNLLIGAPNNNNTQNVGAAYYYRRSPVVSTNWILVDKLTRPVGSAAGLFGSAVGLDIDTGIVGAPANLNDVNNRGVAFMYRFKHNNPPYLAWPIDTQFADVAVPYHYIIPMGTFVDPDIDDSLVLSGSFPSGSNGFLFADGSVTGIPESIGITPVFLEVVDESGASTSHTFDVVVVDNVNLANTPRDVWNLSYFGNDATNLLLEGNVWGGDANPDGDLLDNDQEYAFGSDPLSMDDHFITLEKGDLSGQMVITYVRRSDDPGLTFILQGSTNVTSWQSLQWTVLGESLMNVDAETELVTLTIQVVETAPFLHYRILVIP